ncbi:unnamed protein product [Candidula unifasciata]|uniref:Apoptosis regulator Bcl-2 family BH4 domain-containing protein n=1 Tax=Candidula unifasciata TaxID=100452 RepID=A0A8S4A321_9EUPU|nr:unnamed protein product [Candidula unifasciata]
MVSTEYVFVNEIAYTCSLTETMAEESTRAIVVDYIKYRLDSCGFSWDNDGRQLNVQPNEVQEAMRLLGDAFEERYGRNFTDMIEKINLTDDNAPDIFSAIMDEMFTDGVVNWGRIVALFGFTGRFAVYCFQHNMPAMVDNVVELVTTYIDSKLRNWMDQHNHWNGFLEFQAVEPASSKLDLKWPSFGSLCGLAIAGLGFITLRALFTQHS